MTNNSNRREPGTVNLTPLKIALIYAIIGGLWILFSDRLVAKLVTAPSALTEIQTYKGWFYILTTAVLLYLLIKHSLNTLSRSETELKATSTRLETALKQLTFHVENSPLAVIEWDNHFRVRRWSWRAEQLFGWTAEEVKGKNPLEIGFIYADDVAIVEQVIDRLLTGNQPRSVNRNRNFTRDGRVIHCEWYESTLFDDAGQLVSILSLVHDVTAQVEAEESLRESEERFRATFEQAAVGLSHVGLDYRWLRVNGKLCEITGYPCDELTQITFPDITHPDDLAADLEQTQRLLAGEIQTFSMEKRYFRKDSSQIWVNLTVSLLRDPQGQPKYFIVVVQDINERKQLEEQLRQSQKMEAIGRLAGGVAHDFNNLLTVMMGYNELAINHLDKEDPLQKNLREIQKATERASRLTRQLLAFSRRQVLQPTILNLSEIVSQIGEMLQRLLGEDIELVAILPEQLGRVKADPFQIEQVMMNLAVNARDAMPEGGKLTIELANVELDDEYARRHVGVAPGSYVRLAVSDTGIGMDKETQSRIFEPFFTTKEQGKGTGLGLATVYGIISQSEGAIQVYSEPGWGTTFKIYLPQVSQVAEPLPVPLPWEPAAQASETILLVEDEPNVRELILGMLKDEGYTVLEASNSAEALHFSEQFTGPIHLLLTDVIMPGLNGRHLAERLLQQRPHLKVLYLSGYTDNAIVHHGVLDAGVAFLHKPFTPQDLARKLREVLDTPDHRPPTADR